MQVSLSYYPNYWDFPEQASAGRDRKRESDGPGLSFVTQNMAQTLLEY